MRMDGAGTSSESHRSSAVWPMLLAAFVLALIQWRMQADESELDPAQWFLAKLHQAAPVRIRIDREYEKMMGAVLTHVISTSSIDLFEDGSASALNSLSTAPGQQSFSFKRDSLIVQYGAAKLGTNRLLLPFDAITRLQARVLSSRGFWDHPAADAFQGFPLMWLPPGPFKLAADGTFACTNGEGQNSTTILGVYLCDKQIFSEFTVHQPNGVVARYEYGDFTNYHGCCLAQSLKISVKTGAQTKTSHSQFHFEKASDLLAPAEYMDPPAGADVTDERFTPSLTYYKEKLTYSMAELEQMHREQSPNARLAESTRPPRWPLYFAALCTVSGAIYWGVVAIRKELSR